MSQPASTSSDPAPGGPTGGSESNGSESNASGSNASGSNGSGRSRPERPAPRLTVLAIKAADQHVLVVTGEADLHTASQLRSSITALTPAEPCSVIVELSALDFCDLNGLDALHDAAAVAALAGVELVFHGASPRLSWLHRSFPPRSPRPSPAAAAARSASGPGSDRPGSRDTSTRRDPARPGPAQPPVAPAVRQAAHLPDPWRELEIVVQRLAQLVLCAAALAERYAALPTGETGSDPRRAQRLQRLRAGIELGQHALAAAVALT